MKSLKDWAYIAVIVLAVLVFGCLVWFSGAYFFSLDARVNQNTQNIQAIIQYLNQRTQPPPTAPSLK